MINQSVLDPQSGLSIELAKVTTTENDYEIVIQQVTSSENAKHIQ